MSTISHRYAKLVQNDHMYTIFSRDGKALVNYPLSDPGTEAVTFIFSAMEYPIAVDLILKEGREVYERHHENHTKLMKIWEKNNA
jgi:hypothetical protein